MSNRPPMINSRNSSRLSRLSLRNLVTIYDNFANDNRESNNASPPLDYDEYENRSNSFGEVWSATIQKIFHKPVVACVTALSLQAAKFPRTTIASVLAISFALLIIGLYTNFSPIVSDDTVWSPNDARSLQHMRWIDNKSGFPKLPRYFVLSIHRDGENVLDSHALTAIENVFEAIEAVESTPGFDELCGNHTCPSLSVANFWKNKHKIQDLTRQDILEAISQPTFYDGTPPALNEILGEHDFDKSGEVIRHAKMLRIIFPLPNDDATYDFEGRALDEVLALRERYAKGDSVNSLEVYSERTFPDELTRAILDDLLLIPSAFLVMSVFTCLVFLRLDPVKSRTMVGFGAVVCVVLSIMSGYGLLFIIGVPYTSMTQVLPFIMFGIGLDDAYIISGSFYRTNPDHTIENRVMETMKDVAVGITLTTVTSSVAFIFGGTSSVPTVFWLCWYAFPTIIIDFLYQITFFVAIMAIDEERVKANRRDCCICLTVGRQITAHDDSSDQQNDALPLKSGRYPVIEFPVERVGTSPVKDPPVEDSMVDRFMIWYARQLRRPWVKALVLLSFTGLFAGCAVSTTKLTQEFSLVDVFPDDSYAINFWQSFVAYTAAGTTNFEAYFRFVDQSDPSVQAGMENFIDDLAKLDQVNGEQPAFFWLRDFKKFVSDNKKGLHKLSFPEQIATFLNDPVYGLLYHNDLAFDENGNVTASRCNMYLPNLDEESVHDVVAFLRDQAKVSGDQKVNKGQSDWAFFTYNQKYNGWSFLAVAVDELTYSTIVGVVSVTLIALIGIPHWTAIFFVGPLISILYIDLLGVLQLGGVHINAVSYICVVMSIGLLVDFIMHVLLRYYEVDGSRNYKVQEMLRTMGSSVLIGGISTFLGVALLGFSSTQIFHTMFLTFVGLVTLGVGHGLIFLPVLLSLIGPVSNIADVDKTGRLDDDPYFK